LAHGPGGAYIALNPSDMRTPRTLGLFGPIASIATLLVAGGCSPERYPTVLHLSWAISNSAGAPVGCGDAEAVTVRYSFSDGSGQDFYCSAGTGDVDSDANPDLMVTAVLLDVEGLRITQSPTVDFGPVDWAESRTVPTTMFVLPDCAPGHYTAEWTVRTASGDPASCPPGSRVTLNTDTVAASAACEAGMVTSAVRRGGTTHLVSLTLRDANGVLLGSSIAADASLDCGATSDLGVTNFSLPP
jgi:hypothetical protein